MAYQYLKDEIRAVDGRLAPELNLPRGAMSKMTPSECYLRCQPHSDRVATEQGLPHDLVLPDA